MAIKYRNKKIEVDGILFDSKKEARRFEHLKQLEKAGVIKDLQMQVKYMLIPSQRIDGKVVEREITYIADFVYFDIESGTVVVEDVKNPYLRKEPRYVIKRKMMLYFHGIRIREI